MIKENNMILDKSMAHESDIDWDLLVADLIKLWSNYPYTTGSILKRFKLSREGFRKGIKKHLPNHKELKKKLIDSSIPPLPKKEKDV